MLGLLLLSAACLGAAPLALPGSYSWLTHTVSEAAAQGLHGAWVAKMGFLLMGSAVLWLASLASPRWGRWGTAMLRLFGVMMVSTAVFSHRPWLPDVPVDTTEDVLHSLTATVMGFAFAGGVLGVLLQRQSPASLTRAFDAVAIASSVILPLGMMVWIGYTGALQRLMFAIAYVWYGVEAGRCRQRSESSL